VNPIAFDTETALIRPALLAPPMVCVTWQRPGFEPAIEHVHGVKPRLRAWLEDSTTLLIGHFVAYDMAVVCAEFPDLIPLVFAAYRNNRVTCTKKRQQLLDIAGGVFRGRVGEKGRWITHKYGLEDLSRRLLGKPMVKDGWRLSYAEFRDVPLSQWVEHAKEVQQTSGARRYLLPSPGELVEIKKYPERNGYSAKALDALENEIKNLDAIIADVPEGVIRYPLDDASTALGVFQAQEKHADPYLRDQYRQAYACFVLYLSSTWGLRTHAPGVESLKAELTEAYGELEIAMQAAGMVRDDGTRNMRAIKDVMLAACREYSLPIRRTDAHEKCELGDVCEEHVCLDSDACEAIVEAAGAAGEADDSPFMCYSEFSAIKKMLTNDVRMLEAGTVYPVHTRYDLAETGRTTSSKPNIQNLNTGRIKNSASTAQRLRKGVRQAFVPRPGKVFAQADYPQLELYTLAQCCVSWLGFSKLGEAINAGLDPHLAFAAMALGISYEEALKNKKRPDVDYMRQVGKVFNFGKPGGLGDKKLQIFARKTYGIDLSLEQIKQYTAQWHATFPEMRPYFARVNAMFGDDVERASTCTLFTERWRGGATYCACCNNGFQALGVDCAKAALCLVGEAEYCDTASPLFGSRTVAFVHDEIIVETDDGPRAHDVALELARLMVQGANQYLPDVPMALSRFEPTLMRAWSKDAKQVFVEGRLIPWAPSKDGKKT
jgi:DNA polymerase family A